MLLVRLYVKMAHCLPRLLLLLLPFATAQQPATVECSPGEPPRCEYVAPAAEPERLPACVLAPCAEPVPSSSTAALRPLLLLLHGYNGNGSSIESYLRLSESAPADAPIVVLPSGLVEASDSAPRFWDASPGCCDFEHTAADDAAYLRRLIETVQARWPVDPRRVYVLGHSNGGYMSHRMACEHADLVAGIVSLAGAAFDDPVNIDPALARCKPSEPVHILEIHGEEDGTVLYAGGRPVNTPSARETVAGWAVRNGKNRIVHIYIWLKRREDFLSAFVTRQITASAT